MTPLAVHLLAVHWDCSVVAANGHCELRQPWDSGGAGAALAAAIFFVMFAVGASAGGPKKPGKK